MKLEGIGNTTAHFDDCLEELQSKLMHFDSWEKFCFIYNIDSVVWSFVIWSVPGPMCMSWTGICLYVSLLILI